MGGTYSTFVPFVEKYLEACKEYPNAIIEVTNMNSKQFTGTMVIIALLVGYLLNHLKLI